MPTGAVKVESDVHAGQDFHPAVRAQILTFLKLAQVDVGLIIDFNVQLMKDGITPVLRFR